VVLALSAPQASAVLTGTIAIELETDKTGYQLGEEVHIVYRVSNMSDCTAEWSFAETPGWDVWAFENPTDLSMEELLLEQEPIWTAVWIFTGPGGYGQEAGEIMEMDFVWDLSDIQGNPVLPNEYELVAVVYGSVGSSCGASLDLSNAHVHIAVVPEPSALGLLGWSGLLLARRRLTGRRAG